MEGPGEYLGYRATQRKVREQHKLAVPHNFVYDGSMVDPGPNHTYSGDGHDKLMGFMNSTFPVAVYGLQDAFSGYILNLKLWTTNSHRKLIGR
ncbi:unnamed protein product [Porites lobata]|uniref:Uncharacterized protein n=1 Tax=Porites lobata TaxID=104759 RepID=A0ABN8Q8D0_9CNID|nr:unnamed protein product [Porites lobata]